MSTLDQPLVRSAPPGRPRRGRPADPCPAPPVTLLPELLGAITAGLARSPASWEPLVAHDEDGPTVELLLPSSRYDVYVESWGPGHELHLDRGDRSRAVTVVAGALVLTR